LTLGGYAFRKSHEVGAVLLSGLPASSCSANKSHFCRNSSCIVQASVGNCDRSFSRGTIRSNASALNSWAREQAQAGHSTRLHRPKGRI